jgi:formamidopyrimidine-DNA glycosylase
MPELPEVESLKEYMNSTSLHKKIKEVDVLNKKILTKISPTSLKRNLIGNKFKSTKRHGKNMFTQLSNKKWLTMHFGMTGQLKYFKNKKETPEHTRLLIKFNNGYNLAYDCMRMLGKVGLIDDISEYIKKKKLGLDPIGDKLSFRNFYELFDGRTGTIKSALMNQSILAGIGNIYSDEILFQAGIHPSLNVKKLREDDLKTIYQKINTILKKAISVKMDSEKFPKSYLLNNRKPGTDCSKCNGKIMKETIGGRSSYFCNKHQKKK